MAKGNHHRWRKELSTCLTGLPPSWLILCLLLTMIEWMMRNEEVTNKRRKTREDEWKKKMTQWWCFIVYCFFFCWNKYSWIIHKRRVRFSHTVIRVFCLFFFFWRIFFFFNFNFNQLYMSLSFSYSIRLFFLYYFDTFYIHLFCHKLTNWIHVHVHIIDVVSSVGWYDSRFCKHPMVFWKWINF